MSNLLFWVLLSQGAATAWAQESGYQLGYGIPIGDHLTIGGYFSAEYANNPTTDSFVIDDVAILAHGELGSRFSYLGELESVDFYHYDFETGTTETNLPPSIERLYGDYRFSDYLSLRVGKQITPIGYWNLQPINVLRETTSNPRYSRELFPKFLSGADLYGYAKFDEQTVWHLYLQATEDLDDTYVNMQVDEHTGLALEREMSSDWSLGGSLGRFSQTDGSRTRYTQINSRYSNGPLIITGEAMVSNTRRPIVGDQESRAVYMQGEYHFDMHHALVMRNEYFSDQNIGENEHIQILGYSYRPTYPVSIKLEYQWHSDPDDNQLLTSFSVLF